MLFGTRSEKLRRQVEEAEALLKLQEQQSDCYNGRDNDQQVPASCASPVTVVLSRNIFPARSIAWSLLNAAARTAAVI